MSSTLRSREYHSVMSESGLVWRTSKSVARKVWFRPGTARKCFIGPYAGLTFEICPQLLDSRMIVFYGAYEPEVTRLLEQVLRPGMIALDVGAHVGVHALYMAKLLRSGGLVYAFEPCPENFDLLQKNVLHNREKTTRIIPIRKAVGATDGVAGLTLGVTDGTHHLTQPDEAATLEVEVTTLDNFWRETQQSPHLILADVEGEEMGLLEGGEKLIRQCKPKIILEHHGPERRWQSENWLKRLGYSVQSVGTRHIYAE